MYVLRVYVLVMQNTEENFSESVSTPPWVAGIKQVIRLAQVFYLVNHLIGSKLLFKNIDYVAGIVLDNLYITMIFC